MLIKLLKKIFGNFYQFFIVLINNNNSNSIKSTASSWLSTKYYY